MQIDQEFRKLIVPLQPTERKFLEDNIKKNGCRVPLDVWKEEEILLDGHNRIEICEKFDIEYSINYVSLPDRNSAKIWILENQAGRRNLTKSQLAILALDLEPLYAERATQRRIEGNKRGGSVTSENTSVTKSVAPGPPTYEYSIPKSDLDLEFERVHGSADVQCTDSRKKARDEVADLYGIAPRQVQRAKSIKEKGIPELMDGVRDGTISVRAAERVSRLSEEVQRDAVEKGPEVVTKVSTVVKELEKAEKSIPGIIEKASFKIISGESETPKEAIQEFSTDIEFEEFKKFNKQVRDTTDKELAKVAKRYAGNGDACLMPNVSEMWCSHCKWGFDVYLPLPSEINCPYCGGSELEKRDKDWYPGCDTE